MRALGLLLIPAIGGENFTSSRIFMVPFAASGGGHRDRGHRDEQQQQGTAGSMADQIARRNFLARLWGQKEPSAGTSAGRPASKDALVLVVDDSRTIVVALQRALESDGYLSMPAFDGMQAVEIAKRRLPDLILMDIVMPRMNGFEAMRVLATDPQTRHIPVIMVSGTENPSDRLWGAKLGAKAFLTKPIAREQLLAKVAVVLALSRRLQGTDSAAAPAHAEPDARTR
jgi:twitching motility two-component system response regulator PilH